ncbi:MAG: sensor histidine kinase [Anaerolineae bacterium]
MGILSLFTTYLIPIHFLYGLAFFTMGVAVWLEASRPSTLPLARTLPFLAAFGVLHGAHGWVEMFYLMAPDPLGPLPHLLRLLVLAASFILLIEFGVQLLVVDSERPWQRGRWAILAVFLAGMGLIWATWGTEVDAAIAAVEVWCRYSLAVPGAMLAAAGLLRQSHHLAIQWNTHGTVRQQTAISRDLLVVGLAFLLYGISGQIFVNPSPLPPSTVVNSTLFLQIFHFPVHLPGTVMAGLTAIFVVRALRIFELERQRRMEKLNQARLEAQQRLAEEMVERETLRRELFRQTVQAEERRRIARELHDEAGQALTAIAWELTAVEKALYDSSDEARDRIGKLRRLTDRAMSDLRQLTGRLRPAALDELGLVPALISYADDCSARFPFVVDVEVNGQRRRLPPEIENMLYRIAQEAITNVAKHAQATHASIHLHFDEQGVGLSVTDDGVGIDVDTARGRGWGLAGVYERIQMVEGRVDISSTPDTGTDLSVWIPTTKKEEVHETDPVTAG